MRIDLNADMAEGFGPWAMGDDAGLLQVVTSANVACGFHAGDPMVMARAVALAGKAGVAIGAHPGFADLRGFGRRRLSLPVEEVCADVQYQIGALQGMARAAGARVGHVKLHGALANMAAEDQGLAEACYGAALAVDAGLTMFVIAGTAQERAAQAIGCAYAGEVFADRAYGDDGLLVDRARPGAVLHDPGAAAARLVDMVREGSMPTLSGRRLPARIDTVCLHGDTATALAMAQAVRGALEEAGATVAAGSWGGAG